MSKNKFTLFFCIIIVLLSCKKRDHGRPTAVPSSPQNPELNLKIGQYYQGGYIFYLDLAGQHGMVVSYMKNEDNSSFYWCEPRYKLSDHIRVGTREEIGKGMENTLLIANKLPNELTAAKRCLDYVKDGYDDWYLPSIGELRKIRDNIKFALGPSNIYWSSTEDVVEKYSAYVLAFGGATASPSSWKYMELGIFAVRSFLV